MGVTIKTIAKEAKVSRGTVDRVLHNRPGVSDEVRERVQRIAKEKGYKANLAAKALAFQKKPIIIGIIMLNTEDPFFAEIYEGVQASYQEIKDLGIPLELECCIMETGNVDEQLKYIKKLEKKGVSAIALVPLDEEAIKLELNKLANDGIQIVTFNTDIEDIKKLCFIGQDALKSGRVAGQLMGKILPHGGEVAIITQSINLKALEERNRGFEKVIEEHYPLLKIINKVRVLGSKNNHYSETLDLFKRHPDLKGIYITGRGTGGVGQAIIDLNKKDVKLVCFDLIPETVELLKNNTIDFTITQDPYMQGYLAIKVLFEFLFQGKLPDKEYLYTSLEIKIKENI